jgi:hypothetical protein
MPPLKIPGQSRASDYCSWDKPLLDILEFRTVRTFIGNQPVDTILCEGIVLEPPKNRD